MKIPTHLSIAVVICGALLAGCASGPQYSDVKKSGAITPHNGKGMVLLYRTPGFVGAAYKPYVYANQGLLGQLPRGGFYSYEAAPGPLNLAFSSALGESTAKTKAGAALRGALFGGGIGAIIEGMGDSAAHRKNGLDISVLPNQTHYIVMGGRLKEVSKEEGEDDIADCAWLNPPKH